MGELLDINKFKPHLAGKMVCLECKHNWVGVSPLGISALECPQCGMIKGVHVGVCCPDIAYTCKCGNHHFFIVYEGKALCCYCGEYHEF